MSDAVVTLLAGLGGALIGAGAALGAQWIAIRHNRQEDRRRELVDIVARFWEAADRLWRTSEALDTTIISLMNAESSNNPEVARIYEERRQSSLTSQHTAETEGLFLIAQMRLLYPDVATPLRSCSLRPAPSTTSSATSCGLPDGPRWRRTRRLPASCWTVRARHGGP